MEAPFLKEESRLCGGIGCGVVRLRKRGVLRERSLVKRGGLRKTKQGVGIGERAEVAVSGQIAVHAGELIKEGRMGSAGASECWSRRPEEASINGGVEVQSQNWS